MKVRATLRLRNEALIAARERLGLSQKAAADRCGVNLTTYGGAEAFDLRKVKDGRRKLSVETAMRKAEQIARGMGVDISDVVSAEFFDTPPRVQFSVVAEMTPKAILAAGGRFESRNALPATALSDADEQRRYLERALQGRTERERMVVTLLYGLDGKGSRTLDEVGKTLRCSRERVRQLEARALRKIRDLHPRSEPAPV